MIYEYRCLVRSQCIKNLQYNSDVGPCRYIAHLQVTGVAVVAAVAVNNGHV